MRPVPGSQINIDRETAIRLSLAEIRGHIAELLEVGLKVERKKHEISLCAVFPRATIGWRDLRFITGGKCSYLDFEVPEVIFEADSTIQKEFLRGVADTSAEPSYADRDQNDRQRIVIQVQFGNWLLPVQLCRLPQEYRKIPVSHVLWGHPNIRTPGGDHSWTKETRIRVFAEAFETIGFHFKYKRMIFEEMVRFNKERGYAQPKFCNPKVKKIRSRKPRHVDEGDMRLPDELRGKHFNGYYKICKALGCRQGKKGPQKELFDVEDEL